MLNREDWFMIIYSGSESIADIANKTNVAGNLITCGLLLVMGCYVLRMRPMLKVIVCNY